MNLLHILGIIGVLAYLREIKGTVMATQQEFQAGFAKIDTATNALAARIEALVASLKSGLTPAEEAAALAQLEALVPVLEGMANDPGTPVPVPVPPEEPTP